MKYLLLAVLAYAAWRWYAAQKASDAPAARASKFREPPPQSSTSPPSSDTERMVVCAHCGIHLPQSEAVRGAEALDFCSEEHQRQYARPPRS